MAALITSALAASSALCAALAISKDLDQVAVHPAFAAAPAAAAFAALWLGQMRMVRNIYDAGKILDRSPRPKAKISAVTPIVHDDTSFRAGVGVVLVNEHEQVLILERVDIKNAWQFPQGGIESGESPREAAARELHEELGLVCGDVEEIAVHDRWLAYELPTESRTTKTGRGQVQLWFFMRIRPDANQPAPERVAKPEFRRAEWVSFDEAVARANPFRKPIYAELREKFSRYPTSG